ncbi:Maf/Ham1 [Gonapodya prolifera JEL478]|uniref:inosine/xanthosine triphosphatase n=1 Tax=Gonapodya prolifera (strain JEL478) TaxID=1344416 RepID=A0A139AB30_GONPJ|nr:Maf/Ham1 [Gonapodya prolifera JEL478]|eukprot:KXS14032.1 Maf/Ham1 [Gonapodya prolifera JEL478]
MSTTQQSSSDSATAPVRIAVGSQNAAKLRAVKTACDKIFAPRTVEVVGTSVSSEVSDQPLSDEEAMKGAINRAKSALAATEGAMYGVGLEGGAHQIGFRWFECGWIAVIDPSGQLGLGTSARFELSPKIMRRILSGNEELAQVMDDLSGTKDVRNNMGAMGLLTNGNVDRDVAYAQGVHFAFAPFVSDPVYWV